MSRLVEQVEPEVTALLRLPADERRAAVDRLLENRGIAVSTGLLKTLARWVLGGFWAAIMMAQVFVTVACLGWLGNPRHAPSAHMAEAAGSLYSGARSPWRRFPCTGCSVLPGFLWPSGSWELR